MGLENGVYYQINWKDDDGLIALKIPTKGNESEFPSFMREDGIQISVPIDHVVGPVVVGSCALPVSEVAKHPLVITAESEKTLLGANVDIDAAARDQGFDGYTVYKED